MMRLSSKSAGKKMEITGLNSFAPLSVIITGMKPRPDDKRLVKYSYTEFHADSTNGSDADTKLQTDVRSLCVLFTVLHLGIILVNDQPDAQFFFYMFISILYMFRANSCSSSGESIVSIQRLVCVTLTV
jgi:hypothetical protein